MKIGNKLTLLFSAIFAGILLLFVISIYFSYEADRKEEFINQLKQEAITKVHLVFDVKIKPEILQSIYKHTPHNLIHEEVAIYDTSFNLLYHDAGDIDFIKETPAMNAEILARKELNFVQDNHQAVGLKVYKEGKVYVVTAAAYDEYGFSKLRNLLYTLIIAFSASMILIFFAGSFFSRQALKPVKDMVIQVNDITANNLDSRISEGNRKDELAELAITFNHMLNRLEKSFDAQKQFVSNISHELRTPLAALIGELELSQNKDRTLEEYKEVIRLALNDANRLVRLSNGLLDLAKASYDQAEISFKEIRLDELLLDARQVLLRQYKDYKINIHFESIQEDYEFITVNGNEYLLKVAFTNLMENGCKFSQDHQSDISIKQSKDKITLLFHDKGIGISEQDLPFIFNSFYRGENKSFATGNGLGLSLTQKIIHLHKGNIFVESAKNIETTFTVEIPNALL